MIGPSPDANEFLCQPINGDYDINFLLGYGINLLNYGVFVKRISILKTVAFV